MNYGRTYRKTIILVIKDGVTYMRINTFKNKYSNNELVLLDPHTQVPLRIISRIADIPNNITETRTKSMLTVLVRERRNNAINQLH